MKIYFIRHGQTISNSQKVYMGRCNSPFTDMGISQNDNALSILSDLNIDAIYSSPSERCFSSAQKLANDKSLEVTKDKRLYEIDFGRFEGLTWEEAKERFPDETQKMIKDPNAYTFPNGESQADLDKRAKDFALYIKDSKYDSIAIFSHGGTIMSVLCALLGLEATDKWHFKIEHGSVAAVEITDGYACILL